jgi:hypothetical protein
VLLRALERWAIIPRMPRWPRKHPRPYKARASNTRTTVIGEHAVLWHRHHKGIRFLLLGPKQAPDTLRPTVTAGDVCAGVLHCDADLPSVPPELEASIVAIERLPFARALPSVLRVLPLTEVT